MSPVGLPGFAVHPGEILAEEFMKPLGISQVALAERIGVSPRRINEICRGKRAVSAETAFLLAKAFGTDPQIWMNLQATYDLVIARDSGEAAAKKVKPFKAAS
jgi:addiction module HigA family antidote